MVKKQQSLLGFLFLGFGVYFLLRQLNMEFLHTFYSWSGLLIIIGTSFLLHSYLSKEYSHLFIGGLLLGLGIHGYGNAHLSFWIDHWGMYLIIVGAAFLISYQKTKSGLIVSLALFGAGVFVILSPIDLHWLSWIQEAVQLLEQYWPVVVIAYGGYLIKKG